MAEDNSSIQVLLIESPSINNGVPGFIEEEIVCSIPDDIEVIQLNNLPKVNFNKPLPPSKPLPPKKQPPPKTKRKRTAAERAKARANKIQPLITLPKPSTDSFIDVCGLKVPLKTLLENPDIRKQLAPFIEEIVVSDISDASDVEEISQVQRKKVPVIKEREISQVQRKKVPVIKERKKPAKPRSNKKRKKSPEPTVKEGTGPFVEVLIPDVPDSTELLGGDIIVNLPLAIEKDAIHDTQEMYVIEEQIQLITDSSDDEPMVEQQNNGMQKKKVLSKKVKLVDTSKNNSTVYKKPKTADVKIPDSQVVVLDDVLEENNQNNNLDTNNVQEASVMESDDWYYLNMAIASKVNNNSSTEKSTKVNDNSNTEKSTKVDNVLSMTTPSKIDDNLTMATISEKNDKIIKNSLPVESDQDLPNQEPGVETAKPRKRKKRRRIPWSRHAIRGTRVSKNVKAKLQGKIVKGGVKNITTDVQDMTKESHIHKKAENAGVLANATNNAPKTSILDKNNINHNSPSKKEPLPVVHGGTSFTDSNEPKFTIKQEPMLENNVDETTAEVSEVITMNEEIDENKLRIKLEQEVSWNTDVNYQNSYVQENLNEQPSVNLQPIHRNMTTRQKQSKLSARRSFFGRRRAIGKCDNCGKKYARLGALRRHQLTCKVIYECAMCTFSTSDKIAFREHLANHILGTIDVHSQEEEKSDVSGPVNNLMAYCSTCSEDSTAVEGLNKCQKCLGYLEYYRCKICEKLFEDYSSLRKHILISLQGAQVAQSQRDTDRCSKCGANGFSTKCEFRSHLVSKCGLKKTIPMKIPYVRLERCKIPQKLTKVTKAQQYRAKSYCPKCTITSIASKGWTECDKCNSKLSFICEVCRNLSITHADLRLHMFSVHSIDLGEFTENNQVPEQKCLSIEKEKSCRKDKSLNEKEYIIQDPTARREELVINLQENAKISSANTETTPTSDTRQITRFDEKIPSHEQKPNIGTVIKMISPIKRVASKSTEIEKQVPVLETSEESNSDHSTDKYIDQYSVKVVNSKMVDGSINKTKSMNRKIKSSIMRRKQYFKRDNGTFEKEFKKARFRLAIKTKFGPANQIKRFCIKCDKTKKYYEKIKMGLIREICRKCKMQLLYQCKNCHGICQDYQKMTWHVLFRCRPRLRFFTISHKSHLRKILESRYALLEAQRNIFDSIASQF